MSLPLSLHQLILIVFAIISLIGNCILIILILHRESVVLGNYRWLLLSFCIGDITISLFHAYAVPMYSQIEYGCVAYTQASLGQPRAIGFLLNTTFCALFFEPFILLMFHFLYRYLLLYHPKLVETHPAWSGLIAIVANALISAMFATSNVIIEYNLDNYYDGPEFSRILDVVVEANKKTSIIVMIYFKDASRGGGIDWMTVGSIVNSSVIAGITLTVNVYCSMHILGKFKSVAQNMSQKSRQLQIQLFHALLLQFFVPFFLCFIPFSILITLPLTGLFFGDAGTVILNIVSVFPAVDALIVIFLVGRFRNTLFEWFSSCLDLGTPTSVSHTAADITAIINSYFSAQFHYDPLPSHVMYFVNYLNRKKTDPYYPAFEIIYGVEFAFIVAAFVAGVVIICLTYRTTQLHRLIRLRIISALVNDLVFIVSRLLVMHHEYFGPSEYVETLPLIFGTIMKQIFLGYMTSLLSVLALDRWVATKAWAWYESSTNSTLLFFLLQEAILFSIPTAIGYLLVHEFITSMHVIYCFAVIVMIGAPLLAFVYRLNVRETRELKRGAVIHRYSISRTYQIKENLWILTAFKRIARPLVIVCIPPFIFSPIYQRVPPGIGYDGLRFFAASMYDLWLSMASFCIIISLPYFIPLLRNTRKFSHARIIPVQAIAKIEKNIPETGDAYFAMLTNDLMKGPPPPV